MKLARAETEKHSDVGLTVGGLALKFGDVADILEFGFGLAHILSGFTTKTTKNVAGFLLTADFDEPTWRFGEDPNDTEEEDKRCNLECNWESPYEGRLASHIKRAAIFKPICNHDTEDVQGELDGNELTSRCMIGGFGSPDRNDGVQYTSSPAVDKTGANHPVRVHSGGLKRGAENGPGGTKRDCLDTSILVTEPATNQTANKGSDVIDGHLERVSEAHTRRIMNTYNASL